MAEVSRETALIWVSLDHTYDMSTLVQVMVWCHQATSHYLSQCWPRSLLPYGITRSQWVKWSPSQLTSSDTRLLAAGQQAKIQANFEFSCKLKPLENAHLWIMDLNFWKRIIPFNMMYLDISKLTRAAEMTMRKCIPSMNYDYLQNITLMLTFKVR